MIRNEWNDFGFPFIAFSGESRKDFINDEWISRVSDSDFSVDRRIYFYLEIIKFRLTALSLKTYLRSRNLHRLEFLVSPQINDVKHYIGQAIFAF